MNLRSIAANSLNRAQKDWALWSWREIAWLLKWPRRMWKRGTADNRMPLVGRTWQSLIPMRMQFTMVNGTLRYTYRGIQMQMNPLDMALYLKLMWELKPKTIIEVGTKSGGSAVWFGDMMKLWGWATKVVAIDLKIPRRPWHCPDNIEFIEGDEGDLSPFQEMFHDLPHPWLIVNDASHIAPIMLRGMNYLHQFILPGDYMVIEDGFLADVGEDGRHRLGGPPRAISEFLANHAKQYEIDTRYCDFYGRNVTPSVNGFLKRV